MGASHWIGSVRFELRSSESHALDPLRRALRDDQESILMRPLQRALDRADQPGHVARCRRIEIDLGRIGPGTFAALIEQRLAEAMGPELGPDAPARQATGVEPAEEELLIAFLESGQLAWPSPGKALETICLNLEARDSQALARLARKMKLLFARRPSAAERFAAQCRLGIVLRITAILMGAGDRRLAVGARAASYAGNVDVPRLAASILSLARGANLSSDERRWLEAFLGGGGETDRASAAKGRAAAHPLSPVSDGAQSARPRGPLPDQLNEGASRTCEDAAQPQLYPLVAAGMVLIHPFIAGLFSACGLLDREGQFQGEVERRRAVLLLNFAATGDRQAPEPDLALAKLLCGMELDALVPRAIEPTRTEQAEADRLLLAAIAHWGALGDSSAEALRETFLRRPGRLERRGEGWRLTVEQHGVDILLDRLPWPIGLAVTPFMTRPLRVEWR